MPHKLPPRDARGRFRKHTKATRRNPLGGVLWSVGSNVIGQHIYVKGMRRLRKSGVKSKLL